VAAHVKRIKNPLDELGENGKIQIGGRVRI